MDGVANFWPEDLAWDGTRLVAVGQGAIFKKGPWYGIVMASPDGVHPD